MNAEQSPERQKILQSIRLPPEASLYIAVVKYKGGEWEVVVVVVWRAFR